LQGNTKRLLWISLLHFLCQPYGKYQQIIFVLLKCEQPAESKLQQYGDKPIHTSLMKTEIHQAQNLIYRTLQCV